MRRARSAAPRWLIVVAVAALGWLPMASLAAGPALAAGPTFGTPTIEGSLGQGLDVTQPVTLDAIPDRVELLLTYADAPGPLVVEIPPPATVGPTTLRHTVIATDGHIAPNTPMAARWRITTAGVVALGPEVRTVFSDKRFTWKTVEGDIIRVHWYEGGQAFGERALRIGERAISETSALLGVTEDEPIDFFVYADQAEFYDALGPGTRENVGGQANSSIRTLFALIPPSQIDDPWVANVVPHELVHLVFDTAVSNPYHFPPRWLNEGLAVYLAQGYDLGDKGAVERAASAGDLIPLDGIVAQFPTSRERFSLAYAESVSAVDHIVRTHGRDALVTLIRSYAQGRTDDEAFEAAIGLDVAGLNDAWLTELGAVVPTRHGPLPAPPGPQPADWGDGVPAPVPGATDQPRPSASPTAPPPTTEAGPTPGTIVAGLALAAIVIGGGVLLVRRSRVGPDDVTPPPASPPAP